MNLKLLWAVIGLSLTLTWTFPALALSCHDLQGHRVCLVKIDRSAKYYWQYRVKLTIDGVTQPQQIYNCKDQQVTHQDGTVTTFAKDGISKWICRLSRVR